MKTARRLAMVAMTCLLGLAVAAAQHRDPLTDAEADQLRDAAQDPAKRVGLYVKFLRERSDHLEQLAADPRYTADRNRRIHDLLEDITGLLDEMDANLEQFAEKYDLRQTLREVVALDTELEARLGRMKQRTGAPSQAAARDYGFALQDAHEAAAGSLQQARATLADQESRVKRRR
jgi:hypothetical protein